MQPMLVIHRQWIRAVVRVPRDNVVWHNEVVEDEH